MRHGLAAGEMNAPARQRFVRVALAMGMLAPATVGAQSPWTVSLTPTENPLTIGACGPVRLELKDASGRDAPRNPRGVRVSLADFDLAVSATDAGSVVGKYDGPNHWSVCACQSAVAGTPATITATYPARNLAADARVSGVAFTMSAEFTLKPAHGTHNPPGCGAPGSRTTIATVESSRAATGAPASARFSARQLADGSVELTWTAVPGATHYIVTGPGTPAEGARATGTRQIVRNVAAGNRAWNLIAYVAEPARTAALTVSGPLQVASAAPTARTSPAQAPPGAANPAGLTLVPVNPTGFTATPAGLGRVDLSWNAVPGASYYVLLGPGIPDGGERVRASTTFTTDLVPPGLNTWAVASYYEPGAVSTPAAEFPRATLEVAYPPSAGELGQIAAANVASGGAATSAEAPAAALASGRYLVTMTGLRALMHSNDDMLQRDGKGDEIYAAAYVRRLDRRSGQITEFTNRRSQTYGDVNGFWERIQAGTRSDRGGIQASDPVPAGDIRTHRVGQAHPTAFPMLLWEGTLTDEVDALAISPSIWEADDDGGTYGNWVARQESAMGSLYQYPPVQETILHKRFEPVVVGTVQADAGQAAGIAGAAAATVALQLVFPIWGAEALLFGDKRDQPMGLVWTGIDAFELPNTVVVLTREIIEAALALPAPGMVPLIPSIPSAGFFAVIKPGIMVLRFSQVDGPSYLMYVQVERAP